MHEQEVSFFDLFAGEMVGDVDVLGTIVELRVVCDVDGGHVIGKDGGGNLFLEKFIKSSVQPEELLGSEKKSHVFRFGC